ncbi:hypothetical protein AMTR_s00092p00165920 [Amborella trichopoda]|uniref:Uncharacterized protein n=1 Tax=Amborella trichopoda TaxID=13333 RepID=W1NX87_AMBTC|nr:hypothetical protein AMTR_s00092p00165920 [Amborella trichopoda]
MAYIKKAVDKSTVGEAYVYLTNHGHDPSPEDRSKQSNLMVESLHVQLFETSEKLGSKKVVSSYHESKAARLLGEVEMLTSRLDSVKAVTQDLTSELAWMRSVFGRGTETGASQQCS